MSCSPIAYINRYDNFHDLEIICKSNRGNQDSRRNQKKANQRQIPDMKKKNTHTHEVK